MRNQIMVDFKYEQMKRSKLRERMRQAKKDILAERTDNADQADEGGKAHDEKRQASDKMGADATLSNAIGSNTQRKDKSPSMSELARNNKLPKRTKAKGGDIETVAKNVRLLLEFTREKHNQLN